MLVEKFTMHKLTPCTYHTHIQIVRWWGSSECKCKKVTIHTFAHTQICLMHRLATSHLSLVLYLLIFSRLRFQHLGCFRQFPESEENTVGLVIPCVILSRVDRVINTDYRSGTVNSKSFVGKVFL